MTTHWEGKEGLNSKDQDLREDQTWKDQKKQREDWVLITHD
jgi:hypothetical protein